MSELDIINLFIKSLEVDDNADEPWNEKCQKAHDSIIGRGGIFFQYKNKEIEYLIPRKSFVTNAFLSNQAYTFSTLGIKLYADWL
jgi:hypothetical protein